MAPERRDRAPVDDAVGLDARDELPDRAAVGEVRGAEVDVLDGLGAEAGVVTVDDDDFVGLAQAVDDPAPRGAAAAGDDDGVHTDPPAAGLKASPVAATGLARRV
ncbi:hypothetical protein SY89_01215 [Halolamina pelagica]|uniref:Uncharacterized protein n=1 Tax=Halolamina pelagica TaxID=699431 RepID=A0A0P7FUL7_9EURY|nr:hypothetical protein SY89_01215 [Halolamina pelagica]